MAVTVIGGISAVIGAAGAAGALTSFGAFIGFLGTTGAFTAFAIGAGLSLVSRALAPKLSLGNQMRGITQTTREPAGSRKLVYGQMRVGGQVVFLDHSGTDNAYLHLVIVFASHEIESFEEFWFNDKKVYENNAVVSDWSSVATITKFDGSQTTADSTLVSASSNWTNDHILNGMAYAHFKLEWDQDKFPQGVPNITAVIKGKKVYDPRDTNQSASDSSTWTYSTNPALCLRDYLVDEKYGLAEDRTLIDETVLDATADLCDETQDGGVDIYSISGQKRYTLNGVIDTGNTIKDNIEQLLSAMGGRLTFSGGKYLIEGAEYKTPTITLDESVVISEIQTQTKQSRRGVYNGVKGIFVSEEKNWKVLDYPAQISSTYATEDGDPIYLDMPLPFVTNNLQAQLLAKIALLKSRQQTTLTMTVNLTGLKLKVGDTVMVTNSRLGYSSKVFEVIDYTLANSPGGEIGVQLQLLETASAVYDWTSSDEEDFLKGGELDLYDGRTVDNVTSLTATEIGLRGPDGGVSSSIELSWTAPDDAFVEYYTVRYNKNGTTDYFEIETRETNLLISGLDVTSNYDFRVQAQNLLGVRSSGTSITNRALTGDTTAPSAPTGGAATGGIQTITAEWSNPSDIDFKHVEVYVNTTDSIPASPTAVVDGEEYVVTGLSGAVTRYFWLKSVDFSGNKSAATASFSGTSVVASNSDIGTGAVDTDEIADDAVTVDKIANTLESTNYSQGVAGWKLTTDGTFEAADALFRGNVTAETITVNDQLVVLGPLEAKSLAAGTITREMLSQDVLDEIFGALATSIGGSNGDYKEGAGSFTTSGGTVTLGTSSDKFDHGTADVDVEFIVDHFFYSTTNYTTAQAQATLNFEVSADGTFTDLTSATKTHTLQFNEYDLSSYYGYTYLVYYLTGDVTKTFTSGSGNDIPDDTDLQFRVRVTGVGTAFTSQTVPFTLEANEGVTGVVSTGGNADTLDNLDSTAFLRSNTNDTFDGDLTITGQLILQGSIDQYNVTDLNVTDKTITVNSGNTQSLSDGAGLIVDRGTAADASILWDETNDQFKFTHTVEFADQISFKDTGGATTTTAKIFFGTFPNPDGSLNTSSVIDDFGIDGYGMILQAGYADDMGGIKITDDGVAVFGAGDEGAFVVVNEDANTTDFKVGNKGAVEITPQDNDEAPLRVNRGLDGNRITLSYANNAASRGEIGQTSYNTTGGTRMWFGANLFSVNGTTHSNPRQDSTGSASWLVVADSYADEFAVQRIAPNGGTTLNDALVINSSLNSTFYGSITSTGLTVNGDSISFNTSAGDLDIQALGGSSNQIEGSGSIKIKAAGGSVDLINGTTEVLSTTASGISVNSTISASNINLSSSNPISLTQGGTGTFEFTAIYEAQNDTSGNELNGLFIERGRLSNSSTAEIRHFVVGARGGQKQFVVDGTGNTDIYGDLYLKKGSQGGLIQFGNSGSGDYLKLQDVATGSNLLELYQDNGLKFGIDGVTGDTYIKGRLRTADEGIYGQMSSNWHTGNALRGGNFSTDIANDTTVLKLFAGSPNDESGNQRAANDYNTGIGFMHLDPDSSSWGSAYQGMQAWIGLRVHDLSGQERDFLTFATNNSTTAGTMPVERMAISPEGYVGIGVTDPSKPLDVSGSMRASGTGNQFNTSYATGTAVQINSSTSDNSDALQITRGSGSNKGSGLVVNSANYTTGDKAFVELNAGSYGGSTTQYLHAYDSTSTKFLMRGDGAMGILTDSPTAQLDVRGNVRIGDGSSSEQDILFSSGSGEWQVGTNNGGNGTNNNHFYVYDSAYRLTVQKGTGRVGVATASPAYQFHVSSTDVNAAVFDSSSDSGTYIWIRNSDAVTGRQANLGFAPANNIEGARISAVATEDFSTSANRTADLEFWTRLNGTMNKRMTIQSDGNVGVNTTNFSKSGAKLQVKGTSAVGAVSGSNFAGSIFSVEGSSTVYISMGTTGSPSYYGWIEAHDAGTGTNYDLNLNPQGGDVGIGMGTLNPTNRLHVRYNVNATIANLAEVDNYAAVRIGNFRADGDHNLYIGYMASNSVGLQARDSTADGNAQNILLNPYGGNVSVGTTARSEKLTVGGTIGISGSSYTVNATTANFGFYNGGGVGTAYVQMPASGQFQIWKPSTAAVVTVNTSGHVGIGVYPTRQLHLHDASGDNNLHITNGTTGATASDGFSIVSQSGTNDVILNQRESANIRVHTGNTERLRVNTSGTAQFDNNGGTTGKGRIQFGNSGQQFIEGLDTGNHGSGAYLKFGYGSTTAMLINYSGQVGIGATTIDTKLHVEETTANTPCYVTVESASWDAGVQFKNDQGSWTLYNDRSADAFAIAGNDGINDLVIDNIGRVGINRTPAITNAKLEVGGADGVPLINVEASGNTGGMGIASYGLEFFHGSTARMTITSGGIVLIGSPTMSLNGLGAGDLRVDSNIDIADTDVGSFRIYDGNTFRGGWGTGQWASGNSNYNDKIALLSNNDLQFYTGGQSAPTAVLDSRGQLRVNAGGWPTSTFGDSTGRHIFGGASERLFILWNEQTAAGGNESTFAIGAKAGNSGGTTFGGAWLRGGLENSSDSEGYLETYITYAGNSNFRAQYIDAVGNFVQQTQSWNANRRFKFQNGANNPVPVAYDTFVVTSHDVPTISIVEAVSNNTQSTEQQLKLSVGDSAAVISTGSSVSQGMYLRVNRSNSQPGYHEGYGTAGIHIANNGAVNIGGASGVKTTILNTLNLEGWATTGGQSRDTAIYVGRDGTASSTEYFTMGFKTTARSGEQIHPTNGPYNGGAAFYIECGSTEAGGICLDQDSVHVYGSSDSGATFRVIDKDADVVTFEMLQTSWDGRFRGNVIAYGSMSSISDRRIKTDIKPIDSVLDKINELGVYSYKKITAPHDREEIGVMAQEIQEQFPELVNETEVSDPSEVNGLESILTVDYEHLTAVLLKGMQEQQQQIDHLTKIIEEMKNGNDQND